MTGVRHDPYAELHRIQVETDKPPGERGTYFHPEAYEQERLTSSRESLSVVSADGLEPGPTP